MVNKANDDSRLEEIKNWNNWIKSSNFSTRERYDEWAKFMRADTIKMLEGSQRMGWAPTDKQACTDIRSALEDVQFDLSPKAGWPSLCYELSLIFVAINIVTDHNSIGNSDLAKKIGKSLNNLEKLKNNFLSYNHSIEFSVAASLSKSDVNDHIPNIQQMITSLRNVQNWLIENKQSPRWREKAMRNFRVELAIKIATLFQNQFEIPAKPDGGTEILPTSEANHWTKFFQACALLRMGEHITPDRQSVLWEAVTYY